MNEKTTESSLMIRKFSPLIWKAVLDQGAELLIRQPALLGGALGVLFLQSRHQEALEPEH